MAMVLLSRCFNLQLSGSLVVMVNWHHTIIGGVTKLYIILYRIFIHA